MIFIGKIHINMKNKKLIRLTESDLHRIVKESVNKVIKEDVSNGYDDERVRGCHRKLTQAALEAYKALQRGDIVRAKQELHWGLSDNGFNGWNDGSGTEWRQEFQCLK